MDEVSDRTISTTLDSFLDSGYVPILPQFPNGTVCTLSTISFKMRVLDVEKKLLLQHMILSHHQTPEWGSPKRSIIKEAELLHYLDMIGSRMFDFEKAVAQTEEGTLSARVHGLERKVYRLS